VFRTRGGLPLLLALLAVLATARSAHAETLFGAEGGLSIAGLSGATGVYTSERYGPAAGILARIGLGATVSVQPEVLLTTKGATSNGGFVTDAIGNLIDEPSSTLEVTTLEIPVLMRFTPKLDTRFRPSLILGPAVGFELSEKVRIPASPPGTFDSNLLKSTDFGLAVGFGLELPNRMGSWLFDVRSTFGLTNVEQPSYGSSGIHNWNVVAMLGYGWRR
jgi:hypothetical protein